MVGILLSYWGGLFSGAMLVSGRVNGMILAVGKNIVLLKAWSEKEESAILIGLHPGSLTARP